MRVQNMHVCAVCGVSGLHACLGFRPAPLSAKEKKLQQASLQAAIEQVKRIRNKNDSGVV